MAIYNYKNKFIKLPVYGWIVEVVLADYPLKFAQQKKRFGGSGAPGGTTSAICLYEDWSMKTIIIVKPRASVSEIAHEVWHSVRYMLKHIGADFENENVAYHMGYLTQQVYDFVQDNKTLKKKKEKKNAIRGLLPSSKKEELEQSSGPDYFGKTEEPAIGGSSDQAHGASAELTIHNTPISSQGHNS